MRAAVVVAGVRRDRMLHVEDILEWAKLLRASGDRGQSSDGGIEGAMQHQRIPMSQSVKGE